MVSAKYIILGDWLIANVHGKLVNMVKYGKLMIDNWKKHSKDLNAMTDLES